MLCALSIRFSLLSPVIIDPNCKVHIDFVKPTLDPFSLDSNNEYVPKSESYDAYLTDSLREQLFCFLADSTNALRTVKLLRNVDQHIEKLRVEIGDPRWIDVEYSPTEFILMSSCQWGDARKVFGRFAAKFKFYQGNQLVLHLMCPVQRRFGLG